MGERYALSDRQWALIEPLLPGREGSVGVTAADNRLFVEAVLYRYRAGIPWRDLPGRFGHFRAVHRRHGRWSRNGTWQSVLEAPSEERDNEYAMIDSTIVRAHQHGAGAVGGEKKAGASVPRAAGRAPRSTPAATRWATRRGSTSHPVRRMISTVPTR